MSIFDELKNTKVGDVKAPEKMPVGHYTGQITDMWKEQKAKSGNTALRYPWQLREAGSDVDLEALEAAGGIPQDRTFTLDFWMSPEARFRFTNFTRSCGISEELMILEAAQELGESGQLFTIECKHEPVLDKDTGQPVINEDGTPRVRVVWDNPVGLK